MWKFDVLLMTGTYMSFSLDDSEKSTKLFTDIQDWLSKPDDITTPKSIDIKGCNGHRIIIKVDSIVESISIEKL